MRLCSINTCDKPHLARKLCSKHYYRLKRQGNALAYSNQDRRAGKQAGDIYKIPTSRKNVYIKVDLPYKELDGYNWSLDGHGYACRYDPETKKVVKLHHCVINKPKPPFVVDHINKDKLDNRLTNLRVVTQKANTRNSSDYSHNTSGVKGVTRERGKWVAQLSYLGKNIRGGRYDTIEQASKARKELEVKYWKTA